MSRKVKYVRVIVKLTCSWMEIMDCSAVMTRLMSSECTVSRSPASPYATRHPHSELMITKGIPAAWQASPVRHNLWVHFHPGLPWFLHNRLMPTADACADAWALA